MATEPNEPKSISGTTDRWATSTYLGGSSRQSCDDTDKIQEKI